jgi:transcription-repair coupling factor (superfamily II helicase)
MPAVVQGVFDLLSQRLRESDPYARLLQGARAVVRLPPPAAAWVVRLLGEERDRPALVVVPREADALAWVEASRLVGGEAAIEDTVYFPTPALSPYQEAEASVAVRAQEALALHRLRTARRPTAICTPRALFQPLPSAELFASRVRTIRAGEEHPIEELAAHLVEVGYRRSDLVTEVGVFAVRGGVVDLFPPGEPAPLRLDLYGDEVESIRRFDPLSQRSEGAVETARILPLALFPAGIEQATLLAERLERALGPVVEGEARQRIDALLRGEPFGGWERYLPLLWEETTSLASAVVRSGTPPLVVALDPQRLTQEVAHHAGILDEEHAVRRREGRLAVPPAELLRPGVEVRALLESADLRLESPPGSSDDGGRLDFGAVLTDLFHNQLPRFPREVETARARGERCLLVAPAEHHGRIRELLEARGVAAGHGGVELLDGELERGFRLPAAGVVLFGESQLFPRRAAERSGTRRSPFFSGLRDLRVGDYVVHEDHGIGQFVGMRVLEGGGRDASGMPPAVRELAEERPDDVEIMEIVYATGKSLLLPLERLAQIQKYSGLEGVEPRLDRLGGASWNRTKSRIKRGLRKLATDLLKLYAERELARAPVIPPDSDSQGQFEAAFEHEETPDQLEAIASIKADLERGRPMDRLLCGDVGFGKTEVAMRAAHKVVDGGYQVAVLAPTTILADQHLETFRHRFAGTAVTIDMISRFRSAAEIRQIRERVADGRVDILIGTHRLLSQDIEPANLGLLVIDEEQRFGVAQKERLKELRKSVHVLAMSATPVPRTLQLSLAGVRDMSVIESPPKDRMAVETRILPFGRDLVREAIEFEVERSGQVYYVYNRVETIEKMVETLRQAVPGIRITVGHGQMDERELARRMHAFIRGEYDVLVATTIIENGIDISNVNTMIVHRADRFGLAQLYQLRGRVGRSNQLAYCYLLVPEDRVLSEDARQRLAALHEFTDLGAGFRIAARDLEIRGAGNLLGAEQSGHIAELGIETYLKMLEETVRELRGEAPAEAPSTHLELPVKTSIPAEYIGDTNLRMDIYRRLGSGEESIEEIAAELRDRFGPPPQTVETLLRVAELKRLAERLRVQSIAAKAGKVTFRLRRDARVDVDHLIRFVSEHPRATFSPGGVLTLGGVATADALAVARRTLDLLAAPEPSVDLATTG